MDTINKAKNVTIAVNELIEALFDLNNDVSVVKNSSVGLRDTPEFNSAITIPNNSEIIKLRREMTGHIAAEKWIEGFGAAIQILKLIGSI